jgi:uncharacterized protein (TIGR02145 family)
MVIEKIDSLCPAGWRLPVREDWCTFSKIVTGRADCDDRIYDNSGYNAIKAAMLGEHMGGVATPSGLSNIDEASLWHYSPVNDRAGFTHAGLQFCCTNAYYTIWGDTDWMTSGNDGFGVRCIR